MNYRKTAMRAESASASTNQARSILEFSCAKPESCRLSRFPRNNGISLLRLLLIATLFLCFSSLQVQAQAGIDTGSITGTIKDPTKAVIPGAQLTLTNVNTGVTQKTVSTSAGAYSFPIVQVGTYSLKIEAKGFEASVVTGIVVHLGATDTEDVSLKIGAANTEVTVTSAAPLLQAQDASLGMTVDSEMANELPISGGASGRGFLGLLTLAPGTQPVNNQLIHGEQSGSLDVRVNGSDDNNEVFGGQAIPPIPDTIQEFKLQSGNNGADLGRSYGSVVNVVTKTGTNKFRGEVWEYNENDMYNANDYFNKLHQLVTNATKTPNRPTKFKENSFGGIYSGPVVIPHLYDGHNKTFFTADFQYTYYNDSPRFTGTVPTSTMLSSGFTNLSDTLTLAKTTRVDALGRTFQSGTMFDPATTRSVLCGSLDPITGLVAACAPGQVGVVTDPNISFGARVAMVRDPFLGGSSCPSLGSTKNWVSTFAGGPVPISCFNQLPASRLDPNAIALLKLFPGANQNTAGSSYVNNFIEQLQRPITTKQYDVRLDHTFTEKDSAFVTFSTYGQIQQPTPPFEGVLEGGGSVGFWSKTRNYMVVLTETHVFNPHLVNEFRASDVQVRNTRTDPDDIDNTFGIPGQFGIQGIPQTANNGGLPTINIGSSISEFGSRVNPTWGKDGAWQFSDNLTKIVGRHEWKFGGEFWRIYGDIAQLPYSRGHFTYGQYSNLPTSGDGGASMADFLLLPSSNLAIGAYAGANAQSYAGHVLGGVNGYNGNNWNKSTYHAPYIAVYATDSWKITPRLTASLGMRYEYFGPFSSDGGQQANFWMGGNGNDASGSAYYVGHDGCSTPMSSFFRGLLAHDNIPIICEPGNSVNKMPKANWAPRIGFAYRIRPNLVARLGGGIAYGAFNSIGYGGTLGTNYPFRTAVQQGPNNSYTPQLLGPNRDTTATMENTFGFVNMTDPNAAFITPGSLPLYGKPYHFKVPYVTTLDVALQWQFTNHDSIQATYVGNLGKQLESGSPYHNAARQLLPPGTAALSACTPAQLASNPYCENSPLMADGSNTTTIPFPNLAPNAGPMENTGQVSNYESGELEYAHKFAAGFSMDANYSFTGCWTDTQGGQQDEGGPGNGRAPWVIGFGGYRTDYVRCSSTSRHVFKMSGEFSLPVGKGARWISHANAFEDAIIGGWKLDPIWVSASGVLSNIGCQGTNGYGANPNFNGPWFQTANTAWGCNAAIVQGQHLYGRGPKDLPRTRITGFWNSSAFTAPQSAVQRVGQQDFSPLGVRGNQIYGPGWYNFDLSTHKYFKFSETRKLEVVAESFNVFNHPELNNPGGSSYINPSQETLTTGFGTITGARHGPRTWEFAAKLYF